MAGKKFSPGHDFARRAQSSGGLIALSIVALALLTGYGSRATAAAQQGTIEFRIKDHREAIGDFASLILKIDKIAVSPKAGLAFWQVGWRDFKPSLGSLDLTRYTGRESASVFKGAVDAGSFDAIELKVAGIEGTLKKTRRPAKVKNTLGPVKLAFSVAPTGSTVIVLDLVVHDMSDHPPRGYELGLKGYEVFTNGKLTDKVPPG